MPFNNELCSAIPDSIPRDPSFLNESYVAAPGLVANYGGAANAQLFNKSSRRTAGIAVKTDDNGLRYTFAVIFPAGPTPSTV